MPILKNAGSPDVRLLTVTINEPLTLHYVVRYSRATAEPQLLFLLREIDGKIIRPNHFANDKSEKTEQCVRTLINSICKDHLWTSPEELKALKAVNILPVRAPKAALISSSVLIDLLRHFEMDIKALALEATLICLQNESHFIHRLLLGLKGAILTANRKFNQPSSNEHTVKMLKQISPSYPPPWQPYFFTNSPQSNNVTNTPVLDLQLAVILSSLLTSPNQRSSTLVWNSLLTSHSKAIENFVSVQLKALLAKHTTTEKNRFGHALSIAELIAIENEREIERIELEKRQQLLELQNEENRVKNNDDDLTSINFADSLSTMFDSNISQQVTYLTQNQQSHSNSNPQLPPLQFKKFVPQPIYETLSWRRQVFSNESLQMSHQATTSAPSNTFPSYQLPTNVSITNTTTTTTTNPTTTTTTNPTTTTTTITPSSPSANSTDNLIPTNPSSITTTNFPQLDSLPLPTVDSTPVSPTISPQTTTTTSLSSNMFQSQQQQEQPYITSTTQDRGNGIIKTVFCHTRDKTHIFFGYSSHSSSLTSELPNTTRSAPTSYSRPQSAPSSSLSTMSDSVSDATTTVTTSPTSIQPPPTSIPDIITGELIPIAEPKNDPHIDQIVHISVTHPIPCQLHAHSKSTDALAIPLLGTLLPFETAKYHPFSSQYHQAALEAAFSSSKQIDIGSKCLFIPYQPLSLSFVSFGFLPPLPADITRRRGDLLNTYPYHLFVNARTILSTNPSLLAQLNGAPKNVGITTQSLHDPNLLPFLSPSSPLMIEVASKATSTHDFKQIEVIVQSTSEPLPTDPRLTTNVADTVVEDVKAFTWNGNEYNQYLTLTQGLNQIDKGNVVPNTNGTTGKIDTKQGVGKQQQNDTKSKVKRGRKSKSELLALEQDGGDDNDNITTTTTTTTTATKKGRKKDTTKTTALTTTTTQLTDATADPSTISTDRRGFTEASNAYNVGAFTEFTISHITSSPAPPKMSLCTNCKTICTRPRPKYSEELAFGDNTDGTFLESQPPTTQDSNQSEVQIDSQDCIDECPCWCHFNFSEYLLKHKAALLQKLNSSSTQSSTSSSNITNDQPDTNSSNMNDIDQSASNNNTSTSTTPTPPPPPTTTTNRKPTTRKSTSLPTSSTHLQSSSIQSEHHIHSQQQQQQQQQQQSTSTCTNDHTNGHIANCPLHPDAAFLPPRCQITPEQIQFLSLPCAVPFPLLLTTAIAYFHSRTTPGIDVNITTSLDYASEMISSSFIWIMSELKRPITFSTTLIEFDYDTRPQFYPQGNIPDLCLLDDLCSYKYKEGPMYYYDEDDPNNPYYIDQTHNNSTMTPSPNNTNSIPSKTTTTTTTTSSSHKAKNTKPIILDPKIHYFHPDHNAQIKQGFTSKLLHVCAQSTGWELNQIIDNTQLHNYYPRYKMTPQIEEMICQATNTPYLPSQPTELPINQPTTTSCHSTHIHSTTTDTNNNMNNESTSTQQSSAPFPQPQLTPKQIEEEAFYKRSNELFPYDITLADLPIWRTFLFLIENLPPLHRFRLLRHGHCMFPVYPERKLTKKELNNNNNNIPVIERVSSVDDKNDGNNNEELIQQHVNVKKRGNQRIIDNNDEFTIDKSESFQTDINGVNKKQRPTVTTTSTTTLHNNDNQPQRSLSGFEQQPRLNNNGQDYQPDDPTALPKTRTSIRLQKILNDNQQQSNTIQQQSNYLNPITNNNTLYPQQSYQLYDENIPQNQTTTTSTINSPNLQQNSMMLQPSIVLDRSSSSFDTSTSNSSPTSSSPSFYDARLDNSPLYDDNVIYGNLIQSYNDNITATTTSTTHYDQKDNQQQQQPPHHQHQHYVHSYHAGFDAQCDLFGFDLPINANHFQHNATSSSTTTTHYNNNYHSIFNNESTSQLIHSPNQHALSFPNLTTHQLNHHPTNNNNTSTNNLQLSPIFTYSSLSPPMSPFHQNLFYQPPPTSTQPQLSPSTLTTHQVYDNEQNINSGPIIGTNTSPMIQSNRFY